MNPPDRSPELHLPYNTATIIRSTLTPPADSGHTRHRGNPPCEYLETAEHHSSPEGHRSVTACPFHSLIRKENHRWTMGDREDREGEALRGGTERFRLNSFDLTFHGDNNNHQVSFADGNFRCDHEFL
jgi:hypothetical protein